LRRADTTQPDLDALVQGLLGRIRVVDHSDRAVWMVHRERLTNQNGTKDTQNPIVREDESERGIEDLKMSERVEKQ
jgi:hypothetical protein